MLRDLWVVSIIVNLISAVFGWTRGYRIWSAWATFYLLSALVLRYVDWRHLYGPHGWYVNIWIAQQVWSAAILIPVIRQAVRPTEMLVGISSIASLATGIVAVQAAHWKHSPVEFAMWFFGMIALSQAIVCAVGSIHRPTAYTAILSGFLILYSALMLAGSDYLSSPNLGIAWSGLEIAAFGAWGVTFLTVKHS